MAEDEPPLRYGLVSTRNHANPDLETYTLGRRGWVPIGLLLLHEEPELLPQVVASAVWPGKPPPEAWYAALARRTVRLFGTRLQAQPSAHRGDLQVGTLGELLDYAGYGFLMQDAVQRALPLYRGGVYLEVPRQFDRNAFRREFVAVREACTRYVETVCQEAGALVGASGVEVDGLLVRLPGYTPYACTVDVIG